MKQNKDIILLKINEQTLDLFPYRSPVDRDFLAQSIDYLNMVGASVIAIDIIFDYKTEKEKDQMLRNSLAKSTAPVVVAYADSDDGQSEGQVSFLNKFVPKEVTLAYNNVFPDDKSEVVRRYSGGKNGIDSFAIAIAKNLHARAEQRWHQRKDMRDPTSLINDFIFYHRGPDDKTSYFSEYPIHHLKTISADIFKNKIILIGTESTKETKYKTPFAIFPERRESLLDRIEIHAHVVDQLMKGTTFPFLGLGAQSLMQTVLIIVFSFLGIFLASTRFPTKQKLLLLGAVLTSFWGIGIVISKIVIIPIFAPNAAFIISSIVGPNICKKREVVNV